MPGARFAAECLGKSHLFNLHGKIGRVHLFVGRSKKQIDASFPTQLLITRFGSRIFFEVCAGLELQRVNKNADCHFASRASSSARDPEQFKMPLVQRPHGRHEHSALPIFAPLQGNIHNYFHLSVRLILNLADPDSLPREPELAMLKVFPAGTFREQAKFFEGKRTPHGGARIGLCHRRAKNEGGQKVNTHRREKSAAQVRNQNVFARKNATVAQQSHDIVLTEVVQGERAENNVVGLVVAPFEDISPMISDLGIVRAQSSSDLERGSLLIYRCHFDPRASASCMINDQAGNVARASGEIEDADLIARPDPASKKFGNQRITAKITIQRANISEILLKLTRDRLGTIHQLRLSRIKLAFHPKERRVTSDEKKPVCCLSLATSQKLPPRFW